jgi:hypothetical protein
MISVEKIKKIIDGWSNAKLAENLGHMDKLADIDSPKYTLTICHAHKYAVEVASRRIGHQVK